MLKDKEQQLKNKLKGIIKEIGHLNDVKQDVMNEFKSRNLDSFRSAMVFSENLDLDTLTDDESDIRFLFIFSFALNKALKAKDMDMLNDYQNYFTKIEAEQWDKYKEDNEEEIFPIVFKNVVEISDGYWQSTITAQELDRLNRGNILIYNPNSQRGFKVTKKSIGIDINPIKVREIDDNCKFVRFDFDEHQTSIELFINNTKGLTKDQIIRKAIQELNKFNAVGIKDCYE